MNITFKEKDIVLALLCRDGIIAENTYRLNRPDFIRKSGLDSETVNSILSYFKRIGLGNFNYMHHSSEFYALVRQEAFDLMNRGGFTVQENLLQKEVEKLLLEVERLKPTFGDKVERISTIANNIAGLASAVISGIVEKS
jgi:hypothetical protein